MRELEADDRGHFLDLRHDEFAKRRSEKEKRKRRRERRREKAEIEGKKDHLEAFEENKKKTKDLLESVRNLGNHSDHHDHLHHHDNNMFTEQFASLPRRSAC